MRLLIGWSRIGTNEWVSSQYLSSIKSMNSTNSNSFNSYKARTTAKSGLNVRTGPSTSYRIKKLYKNRTVFDTNEIKGSWAKTPSGWVNLNYCILIYKY